MTYPHRASQEIKLTDQAGTVLSEAFPERNHPKPVNKWSAVATCELVGITWTR